ncbi:hypothetical protein QBC39DRAFT_338693 [Podospora conica]|nr:hypothetical protein QBC39DRAFT_338693 [Schizothecium conicum]
MPPRIPAPQGLLGLTLCLRPAPTPSLQPLIQKATKATLTRKEKIRRMKQDPYSYQQAAQRKAANVSRRQEIEKQRDAEWGSPVHGITTPFVRSFDYGGQQPMTPPVLDKDGNVLEEPQPLPTSPHIRNYLLDEEEVEKALENAAIITKPLPEGSEDDPKYQLELQQHAEKHRKAMVAIQRIADLKNGNAKDRKHANIRRCVEEFGRHNTDHTLERAAPPIARGVVPEPKPPRAGPDTGSSEVQIAILTSKIRALATELEGPKGHRDKNNKRSLRLLCHKRQRLLRYMERKERGSGRWEHMLKTLGLTPATWKEQITL